MSTARTVTQLLQGALRVAGIYEVGRTPSADALTNALQVFQDFIAERAGDLFVPIVVEEAITLVSSQGSYAIGENGSPDLNTQRPEQILNAWIRDAANYDYDVVVIGRREYEAIVDKTSSHTRPDRIWYNPTSPNGTIYTWPVPSSVESLYISSRKTLSEPSTLTENLLDTTQIPRNYHLPLRWLLGRELAEEYGRPVTPYMMVRCDRAESALISLNMARSVEPARLEVPNLKNNERDSILRF